MNIQTVDFVITGNILKITLNDNGQKEIAEAKEDGKNIDSDVFFLDLIEYQLCNGWESIAPDEIGALTNAIILSDSVVRNDKGEITAIERLYSNIDTYQIESPVSIMLRQGYVEFTDK